MKVESSVLVDRPADELWNFMTDWSRLAKMNREILEARQTSEGPPGVGTMIEATLRKARLGNRTIRIRVAEFEPNRKLTLQHTSGPSRGTRTTFSLETVEGKTKLTCQADARLNGIYRLLEPLVTNRAKREVIANLSNVKLLIESGRR